MAIVKRGKMERYEEALSFEKTKPFNKTAFLLVNRQIVSMMAAWPFVSRTIEESDSEDAWDFVSFNEPEWADLAGIDMNEFDSLFEKMTLLNLIYSDGTYPEPVKDFLKQKIDMITGDGD